MQRCQVKVSVFNVVGFQDFRLYCFKDLGSAGSPGPGEGLQNLQQEF